MPQAAASASTTRRPAPRRDWAGLVFAVLVFAFFGWLGYEWLRPLTPREVCERFDKARAADEAKKYATQNLHPALDLLYRHGRRPTRLQRAKSADN